MDSPEDIVLALDAALAKQDPELALSCFDTVDADVSWVPFDADVAVGAGALRAYLAGLSDDHVETRGDIIRQRVLTSDLTLVLRAVHQIRTNESGGSRSGAHFHATALLRRRGGQWRIAHLAEAPLAPMVELIAAYAAAAVNEERPAW